MIDHSQAQSAAPPAPKRLHERSKASPPPLPEPVLLTDADLVDDEDTPTVSAGPQTWVDVEFDCFARTEPPPESRAQRKRARLACLAGLVLCGVVGLLFVAPKLVATVFPPSVAAAEGGARAPARLTTFLPSPPPQSVVPQKIPTVTSTDADADSRPKRSTHGKHRKNAVVSSKKPSQRGQAAGRAG